MRVLIACEFSGIVRNAFAAQGHDVWSCDLQPSETPGQHIQGDFRDALKQEWDFIGFHVDCRVMANSGVRWLYHGKGGPRNESRWQELDEAADLFRLTLNDPRPGYTENSVMHGHAKKLVGREQDQTVQPWYFGDPFFKATALWLRGGLPLLRVTNRLVPPAKGTPEHKAWSMVHQEWPGPNRARNRSRTFPGIAKAFAEQWGSL